MVNKRKEACLMDISQLITNSLTGEPIHDAIITAIALIFAYTFYQVIFSCIGTIFSK